MPSFGLIPWGTVFSSRNKDQRHLAILRVVLTFLLPSPSLALIIREILKANTVDNMTMQQTHYQQEQRSVVQRTISNSSGLRMNWMISSAWFRWRVKFNFHRIKGCLMVSKSNIDRFSFLYQYHYDLTKNFLTNPGLS